MHEKVLKHAKIKAFRAELLRKDNLVIESLWEAPKALLTSLILEITQRPVLIITESMNENRLFEDLSYFHKGKIYEFPASEDLTSDDVPASPDSIGERFQVLKNIQSTKEPYLLLTTLQACLQRLLPPDALAELTFTLKVGEHFSFSQLPERLTAMGYHRRALASDKGEFAIRGGICDLFPASSPDPYRVEFLEDEIVSMRKYDPIGQVSFEKVDEVLITPAQELELLKQQTQLKTLFDYLPPDTLVVLDDLVTLEDKYANLLKMSEEASHQRITFGELFEKLSAYQNIYFAHEQLEEIGEVKILETQAKPYAEKSPSQTISFPLFHKEFIAKRWRHPFFPLSEAGAEALLQSLTQFSESIELEFLCSSEAEEEHLKRMLEELAIALPKNSSFLRGYLTSGFYLPETEYALIPFTEISHRYKVRRQKMRTSTHSLPIELFALNTGDAVVHSNSGIGRYLGIEKRPNHLGVETEFLLLEYAEGAKLYVPIGQAHLISKYIGSTHEEPKFHNLGSNRWKRARERTEAAIQGYASDLLRLQAERVMRGGFRYPEDSDLVKLFADEFPYEETPDQKEAIAKVKEDMLSERPMDRLICGDVGYGKTEIAMRAAFKTVVDGGKQVAVLVPTTVLAMQHSETFRDRMANFPIRIEALSRFRTAKEAQKIVKDLASGAIDIVVGTHRLVSGDIAFKDLGLVIIDEEQRFGVRAKEHLKKIKKEVDCLTLSATPIPRTLYFSLVGARDLSVINTPPEDRLPIQTLICHSSESVLKNALLRELARDGQAFVIHNRVETIFQMADKIRTLLPDARIVVGHGQMSPDEIDLVFHTFKNGKADILVATSIIENGIDIPNANTILIDRADRFGLADLYQMRGRVGRWNRKAYCYFLVPNTRELNEIARRRLSALTQAQGHGGGMKIALLDLEIRGAGNILGTEQSGHISTIGFHLYCKLLKKTILALQKKGTPLISEEIKMEFPFDARLPENYIDEVSLRLELYHRLGDFETEAEIDQLFKEISDRFGPPPIQVKWLYHLSRVRIFALRHQFTSLKLARRLLEVEQEHGKQKQITKRIVLPEIRTPEELETKVIDALKKNFPLRI